MNYLVLSQAYHEHGFLIIEDFLSRAKIDEIDGELTRYINSMKHTGADERVVYEPTAYASILRQKL